MIRNKAIVNEENSDAEYWRKKYLALMKAGANNSNSSNLGSKNQGMMQIDEGNSN